MAEQTRIEQIVCEYRTMFEDVANTTPNVRSQDDVMYSTLNYAKILQEMCEFLEGYVQYRDADDDSYRDKIITSTKKFYDSMLDDMGVNSKYRQSVTLEDMRQTVNHDFLQGSHQLQVVLESMMEHYPDHQTKQLVEMSNNQYRKLAKVYNDDMSLYLWLATRNSKIRPKSTSVQNRMNFADIHTPVIHRLDAYESN